MEELAHEPYLATNSKLFRSAIKKEELLSATPLNRMLNIWKLPTIAAIVTLFVLPLSTTVTAKTSDLAAPKLEIVEVQPKIAEIKSYKFLELVDTDEEIRYSDKDLFCMAKNIYYEAGSESSLGKFAVAQVTINRSKDPKFAGTICEVVMAPNQFTWANNKNKRWNTPSGTNWEKSKEIATLTVVEGTRVHGMDRALYFHAAYVNPGWRRMTRLTQIGGHVFYKPA